MFVVMEVEFCKLTWTTWQTCSLTSDRFCTTVLDVLVFTHVYSNIY